MASGYATPLYLLAFDHRSSFERGLFGATPPLSPEVRDGIVRAKADHLRGQPARGRRGRAP